MKHRILTLLGSILLAGAVTSIAADSKAQEVVLTVSGMHCGSCATGITAMLKRTEGILDGKVNYETREAVVEYDANRTSPEKIVAVIEKMGYKAAVKK